MINWMCLFVAGLLEIVWVVALKYAENFSKLLPTAVFVVSIVSSFLLLNFAIRTLPIGCPTPFGRVWARRARWLRA